MTDIGGNVAQADASVVWQQLSERIDAFISAWEAGRPPMLAEYVPEGPPALRRLTLVEAVKVDLEYRWKEPRWHKTIEQYVADFPELASEGCPPCDIIYEEYHIRRSSGEAVTLGDYCRRFPQRADELKRLIAVDNADKTTTLLSGAGRVPVFEAGQKVDDFDLLAALGKGAFATVFLARQISMQRMVALKISRDRGFEPQTLAQLDHPHIVRVFDQRQLAENKLRLLYMQYVAGGTLQSVIEHARGLPPAMRSGRTLIEAIDKALERRGESPPGDSMTRYRLQHASWPEIVCWIGSRLAGRWPMPTPAACCTATSSRPTCWWRPKDIPSWPTSTSASRSSTAPRRQPTSAAAWPTCRPSSSKPATPRTLASPTSSTAVATFTRWA